VDRVDVLFTNYTSILVQRPEVVPMLPIGKIMPVAAGAQADASPEPLAGGSTEFLFEPSAGKVLGALLPHYLNFKVYQILLEAKASEQSSRMVATDNAKQLIKDLTLEYNKLRQANITKELLEISSAAMAVG
jgi:F-type H+-transporting ATPase subunit gamma